MCYQLDLMDQIRNKKGSGLDSTRYLPGVRCHVVHLASGDAVEMIRNAKFVEKLPLSVETCHHYLNLDAEASFEFGAAIFV